jgi:hypothetical protein
VLRLWHANSAKWNGKSKPICPFALVTSARCLNRVNEKELGNGRLLMSLLWQQLVVFQSFLSPLFIFKLTEN